METGITERKSDKLQPFRVWYRWYIIWFAKTRKEADEHLTKERELKND